MLAVVWLSEPNLTGHSSHATGSGCGLLVQITIHILQRDKSTQAKHNCLAERPLLIVKHSELAWLKPNNHFLAHNAMVTEIKKLGQS
jgi:hypothetical protein